MRIDEVIVPFPTKKSNITARGDIRKSDVVGKTATGQLVYSDELTGQPYIRNKKDVPFFVNDAFDVPDNYDDNYDFPKQWVIVDDKMRAFGKLYSDKKEAELDARRYRQWHHKEVNVQAV
jgi:hypothetical protein